MTRKKKKGRKKHRTLYGHSRGSAQTVTPTNIELDVSTEPLFFEVFSRKREKNSKSEAATVSYITITQENFKKIKENLSNRNSFLLYCDLLFWTAGGRHGKATSYRDISERFGYDRNSINRAIPELEKIGLIKTEKSRAGIHLTVKTKHVENPYQIPASAVSNSCQSGSILSKTTSKNCQSTSKNCQEWQDFAVTQRPINSESLGNPAPLLSSYYTFNNSLTEKRGTSTAKNELRERAEMIFGQIKAGADRRDAHARLDSLTEQYSADEILEAINHKDFKKPNVSKFFFSWLGDFLSNNHKDIVSLAQTKRKILVKRAADRFFERLVGWGDLDESQIAFCQSDEQEIVEILGGWKKLVSEFQEKKAKAAAVVEVNGFKIPTNEYNTTRFSQDLGERFKNIMQTRGDL